MLVVLLSDGWLATSLATLLFESHFLACTSLSNIIVFYCRLLFGSTDFPASSAWDTWSHSC